jgi:HNH endonuclease
MDNAGGYKSMDVDHFRPRGKGRHLYTNLLVATRHCNGAKSNQWPSASQKARGIYLINPYTEQDYGKHLFEDPSSHEILAVTPAGFYQIFVLDLNAPHLVKERAERARISEILQGGAIFTGAIRSVLACLTELKRRMESCIPAIPSPPSGSAIVTGQPASSQ